MSLVVASFVAGLAFADEPVYSTFESFEGDFGAWSPDHYLECEPSCTFEWAMSVEKLEPLDGDWSVYSFAAGDWDDGTVWLERSLADAMLDPGPYVVRIAFGLFSFDVDEINPFPVLAYAGFGDPETEADFTIIGLTDQVKGWAEYEATFPIEVPEIGIPEDGLHVAFGWGVTWEGDAEYLLDAVSVTIEKA